MPQTDHPLCLKPRDVRAILYLISYIFCNLLRLTSGWFNWSREMLHEILESASFHPKLWSIVSQINKVNGLKTTSNRKIPRKRQNASELYLSGLQYITVLDQMMQNPVFHGLFLAIRWINPRSALTNYRKCRRSNRVSRVRHAASNTEDGLPVAFQVGLNSCKLYVIIHWPNQVSILWVIKFISSVMNCLCMHACMLVKKELRPRTNNSTKSYSETGLIEYGGLPSSYSAGKVH